ncbi:reverse transcriptase domain-containing protein [Tanacetum coccineum]
MVKEGIVLGHKISKSEIEVDKAKVDVIAKLPLIPRPEGYSQILGHWPISTNDLFMIFPNRRPYDPLLEKETPFIFSKECIEAFETLKLKLTQAPILVAPDWDLPFEIMCDASDFAVGAVLGKRKTKHFQPIHYVPKQDCSGGFCCSKNLMSLSMIKKGAENLAADHLSRLENPHQSELEKKEITETFPLETLGMVTLLCDIMPHG